MGEEAGITSDGPEMAELWVVSQLLAEDSYARIPVERWREQMQTIENGASSSSFQPAASRPPNSGSLSTSFPPLPPIEEESLPVVGAVGNGGEEMAGVVGDIDGADGNGIGEAGGVGDAGGAVGAGGVGGATDIATNSDMTISADGSADNNAARALATGM